jgi:hypothetical protein
MALQRPQRGFIAQFVGRCTECERTIEIGDPIGGIPGTGYQHVDCLDLDDDDESSGTDHLAEKPTRFVGTDDESMGF